MKPAHKKRLVNKLSKPRNDVCDPGNISLSNSGTTVDNLPHPLAEISNIKCTKKVQSIAIERNQPKVLRNVTRVARRQITEQPVKSINKKIYNLNIAACLFNATSMKENDLQPLIVVSNAESEQDKSKTVHKAMRVTRKQHSEQSLKSRKEKVCNSNMVASLTNTTSAAENKLQPLAIVSDATAKQKKCEVLKNVTRITRKQLKDNSQVLAEVTNAMEQPLAVVSKATSEQNKPEVLQSSARITRKQFKEQSQPLAEVSNTTIIRNKPEVLRNVARITRKQLIEHPQLLAGVSNISVCLSNTTSITENNLQPVVVVSNTEQNKSNNLRNGTRDKCKQLTEQSASSTKENICNSDIAVCLQNTAVTTDTNLQPLSTVLNSTINQNKPECDMTRACEQHVELECQYINVSSPTRTLTTKSSLQPLDEESPCSSWETASSTDSRVQYVTSTPEKNPMRNREKSHFPPILLESPIKNLPLQQAKDSQYVLFCDDYDSHEKRRYLHDDDDDLLLVKRPKRNYENHKPTFQVAKKARIKTKKQKTEEARLDDWAKLMNDHFNDVENSDLCIQESV